MNVGLQMSVIGLSSWRRRSRMREESGTDGERGESRLMMAKGEGYIPCKVLAGAMMVLTIDSPRGNSRARVGYTGAAWREGETMTWRER